MEAKLQHIAVEDALPAVVITMNRPEQRNALSTGLMVELTHALEEQSRREDCRVIVLTGAGPAFSAGHDLQEMLDRTLEDERKVFETCTRMMETIQLIPQPVIAAVNGAAMGWGCDLAVACDIRIAAEGARFGELFVKRGLIPDGGATYTLPRLIGMDRAAELIFTGRIVDAAEALRIGLVTRVVPADELHGETRRLATEIAANAPLAVQTAKRLLYAQQQLTIEQAMEQVTFFLSTLRQSEDHHEGVAAFLEKREAVFRGV